jgi:hypothetical protein
MNKARMDVEAIVNAITSKMGIDDIFSNDDNKI